MIDSFIGQLSTETDESTALAKALLSLVYLIQEDASEELASFTAYLLVSFPPLASRFDADNKFAFVEPDGWIARYHAGAGTFGVAIQEEWA